MIFPFFASFPMVLPVRYVSHYQAVSSIPWFEVSSAEVKIVPLNGNSPIKDRDVTPWCTMGRMGRDDSYDWEDLRG